MIDNIKRKTPVIAPVESFDIFCDTRGGQRIHFRRTLAASQVGLDPGRYDFAIECSHPESKISEKIELLLTHEGLKDVYAYIGELLRESR